jgi:hypothetical protein
MRHAILAAAAIIAFAGASVPSFADTARNSNSVGQCAGILANPERYRGSKVAYCDRREPKHDHYTIRTAPTDEGPSTLAP